MIQRLVNRQRLPRIGKIRLGVKVQGQGGKEYPKEVDHFVIDAALAEVLGDEKPKRISVMFPSDDIEKILPNRYERYAGGLLTLECDGENATEIPLKGAERRVACERPVGEPGKPTPECPCGAKAKGALNVIVLGGGIGTYQVVLGGESRIADLLNQLDVFKKIFGSLTTINGHPIPFEIVRVPQTSQIRKGGADGERLTREGYPVKIECRFTVEQALEARGMAMLSAGGRSVNALTVGSLPSTVEPHDPRLLTHPKVTEALIDGLRGAGILREPPQAPLLDDPAEDILPAEPGDADALAGLRADLETLFSDAAGGNRVQAANLVKLTVKKNLGVVVTGLGDLDEAGLRKIMGIMVSR